MQENFTDRLTFEMPVVWLSFVFRFFYLLKFYWFLNKTFTIMANVNLVFYGTGSTDEHELVVYVNIAHELFIEIDSNTDEPQHITLDKATAIRLVKHLKTQINQMPNE